jgi:hypothetical protein
MLSFIPAKMRQALVLAWQKPMLVTKNKCPAYCPLEYSACFRQAHSLACWACWSQSLRQVKLLPAISTAIGTVATIPLPVEEVEECLMQNILEF